MRHCVRQTFREKLDMAQVTVKIRHLGKAVVAREQMMFKQLYW